MTLSWFLLITTPIFGYSAGTRGKYAPRQPSPLLLEEKHSDGGVDGGYPCSVTCPLDGINYDHCRVFLTAESGSSELTCVSPQWVVSKNVSDVFEAAASTEIANSSGPPSCRDKLQYWVLEWWRGSCRHTSSRLLDVIEYEVNREYSPQGGESHWQCDPRSFSFLPFKAFVGVSGNRGLEWERTDESSQGMPNLPQISAGTSEPRVAGKKRRSPKRKISKLGGSTLWINNPFVTTLWAL
ncbi:hypothetical protein FOZ60_016103 [Perkinsus olseni]|uniref:Uncharacterized protein n=1 Tax=Perkinsus olseni TaxID=32597 RepID=A0A7J6N524_PEROL|nr:hypothetical protein FOZ60_016103 [Perkinsus olseni]